MAGHSLGGAVSLLTYLMQSDHGAHHISKLILLDTASYKQDLPAFISILRVPIINELSLFLTSSNFKSRMILRKAFFDHSKITEEMVATYGAYLSLPGASQALIKTAKQMLPSNLEEISGRYKSIDYSRSSHMGRKGRNRTLGSREKTRGKYSGCKARCGSELRPCPPGRMPEPGNRSDGVIFVRSNRGHEMKKSIFHRGNENETVDIFYIFFNNPAGLACICAQPKQNRKQSTHNHCRRRNRKKITNSARDFKE